MAVLAFASINDRAYKPRSLEIFHFLGMLEDFYKASIRLPRTKFYQEDGITTLKVFNMSPDVPPTPDTPFVRHVLELGLRDRTDVSRDCSSPTHCSSAKMARKPSSGLISRNLVAMWNWDRNYDCSRKRRMGS